MDDSETTLMQLKELVGRFVCERDWGKYHNPKNLSMSIGIETAELMELFQWIDGQEITDFLKTQDGQRKIKEELADIVIYCISMANSCDLDLSKAIEEKIQKNSLKYPVNEFKGKYTK